MKKTIILLLIASLLTLNACGKTEEFVEVVLPADFVEEKTQEELYEIANEKGYASVVLNDDGSVTYTMTKEQNEELLKETKESIITELNNMIGSEEYPNYTSIDFNENFTEFTVTTKSSESNLMDSISTLGFYMYGGFYNMVKGESIENICVKYINESTGEVIDEFNSKDME